MEKYGGIYVITIEHLKTIDSAFANWITNSALYIIDPKSTVNYPWIHYQSFPNVLS